LPAPPLAPSEGALTLKPRRSALADDVASAAQVRALLPAAELVVVTSRYQLPGLAAADGARLMEAGAVRLSPPPATTPS
jgi:hypothetical protein